MKHRLSILIAFLALAWISPCVAQIVAGRGIEIRIMGVPAEEKGRIDGPYAVSTGGTVRMPLIGPNNSSAEISVAGLSTNAAAAKLEALYKNAGIYNNPTIQISASGADAVRQDMVTVSGFVRAPGPKPYTPGLTLYQAVSAGGGPNEFGNMKKVLLMRGKTSRVYDLNILQDRNIVLQPDDTIEVPEKSWNPFIN
jgi:protein involved in polysaccharide export with SLBB domain